jgi:hypothetical protein
MEESWNWLALFSHLFQHFACALLSYIKELLISLTNKEDTMFGDRVILLRIALH